MTAAKTNERPGTRASVRYARVSASKAREVLGLIRNQPVGRALEILDFTERDVATIIRKVLESAVANAEHNDGQAADELAVVACYADEGPTLKRFRPRARGRASRIRKRTCHITLIVARMDDAEIERIRDRSAQGGVARTAAAARRERVARSRQEKAERRESEAEHDHDHDHEHDHDHDHDHDHSDDVATEASADAVADDAVTDEVPEDVAEDATEVAEAEAGDESTTEAAAEDADGDDSEGEG
jgi:large subunit ribosomal protein L22